MTETVIVLGAGMVGVSTAPAPRERDRDVPLVDRRGPGEEASHGNAGLIQGEAVEPFAMPLAPHQAEVARRWACTKA
ncbi:MAG: FAD-dependent oxidoreductase [Rhodospirillum sp.]|nr:FAD-dependent oxidoreductase [Rhodospirillum sp.]MCF8492176.1 FAD-dependent oxidoreductase [Rhodospirillum sp.]MCF8499530.1 FAD-dependent oxidoreductase [Rhodospirillum sp.]